MAARWYVIRIEPRAEYLAAGELDRDGFQIFFPRIITPSSWQGRTNVPLFPGYMFLRCDPDDGGWPSFRQVHRVSGWVKFHGEIPSIPDEDIDELARRLDAANSQGGVWKRFRPGEQVRVVSRAIQGVAEVVEEARSSDARVKVLLNFMGRFVSAQVPWEDLRSMEEGPEEPRRIPRRTRGRGRWIRPQAAGAG